MNIFFKIILFVFFVKDFLQITFCGCFALYYCPEAPLVLIKILACPVQV